MVKKLVGFSVILFLIFVVSADTDGPWSMLGRSGYSGMVTINNATGSSLFYWLFEAENGNIATDTLPLILWLQGGPGQAGESGMFDEYICPFGIDSSLKPFLNNLTWTTHYHVMSVDFPLNVGFSYSNSPSDNINTTLGATFYLYTFLQRLTQKYPGWLTNREFYVFGESYGGGHWAPGLTYTILKQNLLVNQTGNTFINIKGMSLGDPWLDPPSQVSKYASFSYDLGLINAAQVPLVQYYVNQTIENINKGNLQQAWNDWNMTKYVIISNAGGVNEYDMRDYKPFPEEPWFKWINLTSTREFLHAPLNVTFHSSNNVVHSAFDQDSMNSSIGLMPFILDNIKVMIYNGQDDLLVNTPGTETMLSKIQWPSINKFLQSRKHVWTINSNIVGYALQYGGFRFINVLKAGHQAPMNQPFNVRDLVIRFIQNTPWNQVTNN